MDLGTQLGAKLGGKIELRQDKTGQNRTRQDKDKTRTRQDKTLEDRERNRSFQGGRGYPATRGILHWFIPL